jgi:hypothetical protein
LRGPYYLGGPAISLAAKCRHDGYFSGFGQHRLHGGEGGYGGSGRYEFLDEHEEDRWNPEDPGSEFQTRRGIYFNSLISELETDGEGDVEAQSEVEDQNDRHLRSINNSE